MKCPSNLPSLLARTATCFFGLKTNTIQNNSEFQKICKKTVDPLLEIAMNRYVRDYMPEYLSIH